MKKLHDSTYKRLTVINTVILGVIILAVIAGLFLKRESILFNLRNFIEHEKSHSRVISKILPPPAATRSLPVYDLKIKTKNFKKIRQLVEILKKQGSLTNDYKKWFPARFYYKGKEYKVKTRLRGDGHTHWRHPKKSWRIKFRKNKFFQGYRKLDFILPFEKGLYVEHLAYQLARQAKLLVPDSGFAKLRVNGVDMGMYLWIEVLGKEMLERQKYPEGEIFKGCNAWTNVRLSGFGIPELQLAKYSSNFVTTIRRDASAGYLNGRWLTFLQLIRESNKQEFINGLPQILNLEKYLRWNALTWLFGSLHSHWGDNLRWYYDNSEGTFEPILYDISPQKIEGKNNIDINEHDFLAKRIMRIPVYRQHRNEIIWNFINDKRFAAGEMAKSFYAGLRAAIVQESGTPKKASDFDKQHHDIVEAIDYNFKKLRQMLGFNRVYITPIINEDRGGETIPLVLQIIPDSLADLELTQLNIILAESYFGSNPDMKIKIVQPDGRQIEVKQVKVVMDGKVLRLKFKNIRLWTAIAEDMQPKPGRWLLQLQFAKQLREQISAPLGVSKLELEFYNTISKKQIKKRDIFRTSTAYAPKRLAITEKDLSPRYFLKNSSLPLKIKGNQFILKSGTYTIKNNLIFPRGFGLVLESGVKLLMAPAVSIVVYAPVISKGSFKQPVKITSLDPLRPWGSFGIIKAQGKSLLTYTSFEGGSSGNPAGITLSGQLCFYSSEVELRYCSIKNGHADDGLNIKRTTVKIEHCLFSQNASDGFDGDWISGTVSNCRFVNNGGDGLDLSGSDLVVSNSFFTQMKDKALSIGERTSLVAANCLIQDSSIGMAIKDMSLVKLFGLVVRRNETGLSLYRKKQLFGSGSGEATSCLFYANTTDFLLDREAKLRLNTVALSNLPTGSNIETVQLKVGDIAASYQTDLPYAMPHQAKDSVFAKGPQTKPVKFKGVPVPDLSQNAIGLYAPLEFTK